MHWFQQQHEKKRKKRDFGAASYAFADYQPFFSGFGPRPRQAVLFHRQRNRGVPLQNLFTDPLFKEQWYLVSISQYTLPRQDTWRESNELYAVFDTSDYFFLIFLVKNLSMMSVKKFIYSYFPRFSNKRMHSNFNQLKIIINWRLYIILMRIFVDIINVVCLNSIKVIMKNNKNR